jgi:hypothetical protein
LTYAKQHLEQSILSYNNLNINKFMAAVTTRTGSLSTKIRDELLRLKENFDFAVMAAEEQQKK